MEVTDLEAEEDFCVSPCCIEMWEIVGLFSFLVGKTAAPEVKSQVGGRAHISYICFGAYVLHVHMDVKHVHATAAAVCAWVRGSCRQVE